MNFHNIMMYESMKFNRKKHLSDPPFLTPILVLLELDDMRLDISSLPVSSRVSYSRWDGRRLPISIITISITWPTRVGGLPNPRSLSMQALSTLPFQMMTFFFRMNNNISKLILNQGITDNNMNKTYILWTNI